jgi:CubicO group peptidase (beta-lactamase class C family)
MLRLLPSLYLVLSLHGLKMRAEDTDRAWPSPIPMTGVPSRELAVYDSIITETMREYGIPGGNIALMRHGKHILSRGYGYMDLAKDTPVQPDTLFRIASVSKPITAVAVLRLVEQGRLSLDTPVFDILKEDPPPLPPGDPVNLPVTVAHLLTHTGGWDRKIDGDIMFEQGQAADSEGTPFPPSPWAMIRHASGRPLQHMPGTVYAYSNFGYNLLGRIIENRSGKPYEAFVKGILSEAGITTMQLGANRLSGRAPIETRYHGFNGSKNQRSRYPSDRGQPIDTPYHHAITTMDAHGGWIASATDLVRFAAAVDGRPFPVDILTPKTIQAMVARPPSVAKDKKSYYAFGWMVRDPEDHWWHNGSLPGTTALLVRAGNGTIWAGLFNSRDKENKFLAALDRAFWRAYRRVKKWPAPHAK